MRPILLMGLSRPVRRRRFCRGARIIRRRAHTTRGPEDHAPNSRNVVAFTDQQFRHDGTFVARFSGELQQSAGGFQPSQCMHPQTRRLSGRNRLPGVAIHTLPDPDPRRETQSADDPDGDPRATLFLS